MAAVIALESAPAAMGSFYDAVLPRSGHYALFTLGNKRHLWADDTAQLFEMTERLSNAQGVYFATASFKAPTSRTGANVAVLRSLRLDIDAGDKKFAAHPEGAYPKQTDAARAVAAFTKATNLVPSYVLSSGEGLHVYYVLDEDIEPATWTPLAVRLGQLCAEHGLKADPSVTTDTARVLRPPGMLHPNGSRVNIIKATGKEYGVEELRGVLGVVPAEADPFANAPRYDTAINADVTHCVAADPERAAAALRSIPADCERGEWLRAAFAARAGGVRESDYLEWCRTGGNMYTGDDDALKAWNSFKPDRAGSIGAGTLYMMARQHGWQDTRGTAATGTAANDPQADGQAQATDLWLARFFARQCGHAFRFNHSAKLWLVYRAGSWSVCGKGEHVEAMKGLAVVLMQECVKLLTANPTGRDIKKLTACAQRAQSAQGIEAALKLAQSDPALAIKTDELDTDPDLFNVANGAVHLPTRALMPHDPAQMLSRQSPTTFDAEAACPAFMDFMAAISRGDPEWVEGMQRALGYCLGGHVSEEKLFFWLGKGANGKSVLANIVRHIMGTYAATVPPAFMMQSRRDGGSATPELAMLAGARVALANEVEAGSRLSAQTVKTAVSTEHITARALYGAPFTFKPTHKLLIRGNHRPIVTDDDEGIWRRIVLVPFELDVAPQDRDPGLEARLIAEAPGILRWMVEGFVKWKQDGLKPAKRVAAASLAYRRESDLLLQWVTEQGEIGPAFEVGQQRAYSAYRGWCSEQGLRQMSKASFTRGLIERGFGEHRATSGVLRQYVYTGFRLRP